MIIRTIKYIFNAVFWRFLFGPISRIEFNAIIHNFSSLFFILPISNVINLLKDLVLGTLTNNIFYRLIPFTPGFQVVTLIDTPSKRVFWFGFIFTLLIYKWFILFKRLLLWPFKLGIFSFIFSTLGIDMSWFLNWFNIFSFNVPHWVYIQYLTLYNNWLSWWKGTVNTNISLPENPRKDLLNKETPDLTEGSETENNKILNRRNLYILLGVMAIVGLGVWYYYYYDGTGGAGGVQTGGDAPQPAPNNTAGDPNVLYLENIANMTEAERAEWLNRLTRYRLAGRITQDEYEHFSERLMPPLPVYEAQVIPTAPVETPVVTESTTNIAEASGTSSQST